MTLRKILLVLLIPFLSFYNTKGQIHQVDPQSIIADILEDIVASSEDDAIDLDALTDDLIFLSENPINLNSTSSEELGRLIFLTDFQITSLLDYIKQNGKMLTIYELQLVIGFDFVDISRLTPFVIVAEPTDKSKTFPYFKYGKHDLFVRARSLIETQEGYLPPPPDKPDATRYAGNKMGLYTRYSYRTRSGLQLGFVGEKDPGEEFFKGSNPYGFDHYSLHLQVSNLGILKTLVVGDFNAEFGQGLTLWSSASFGKSPDPMSVRKRAKGLNRFSSTNENEFLRGAGATVRLGIFDITAFGSYKKIDANVVDSLVDGEVIFTSRPTSGLHRTPNEIRSKKTIGEMVAGGNVSFGWKNLRGGTTVSLVNLEGMMEPSSQPYRYFEPPLNNRTNVGFDLQYGLGNHMLFGEVATTLGYGSGAVAGGLFRVHPLLKLSVFGRNYQKDYSTYYTNAIADGSRPANESGILTGFDLLPIRHWHLGGYVDFFQSSWLKFGINAPSRGRDYLLQATYSPRSRISFQIRYRFKQKEKNQAVDSAQVRWVLPYSNQALRFHLSYNPTRNIQLRSRIEFSWYDEEQKSTEKGLIVYQDVSYRPNRIPLVLTARYAIFETDSWNARIYAYENDVLYYFSIPAFYSRGTRAYFLAKYSIGKNLDLWFRVAQTFFTDTKYLGSGLDKIEGDTRSDVRLQLRFTF